MGWEQVIPQLTLRMHELSGESKGTVVLPIEGSGKETRSFVFIDDLIAGLMLVLEKGEHLAIYNIGTEDEISIKQLAEEIARHFHREVQIAPEELKAGGPLRRSPSIERIGPLGSRPTLSLSQCLAATIPWYVKNADQNPHHHS